MARYRQTFRVFGGKSRERYLEQQKEEIRDQFVGEFRDNILKTNEDDFVALAARKSQIDPPVIDFQGITRSDYETTMTAAQLSGTGRSVHGVGPFPVPVVVFHLPLRGTYRLIEYQPREDSTYHPMGYIGSNKLCLEYKMLSQDVEQIRKELDNDRRVLEQYLSSMQRQIQGYNNELPIVIGLVFRAMKQKITERELQFDSLGFPRERS